MVRRNTIMKRLALAVASMFLLYATSASANTGDELQAVVNSNVCPANLTTYALPDYASAGCEDFTHGDNYDVIKANECMNEVDHETFQIIRYNSFVQRCAAEHASQPKDLSRDILNKTASGVPDVAGKNALRMANLAAEEGWVSPSKGALIQSAVTAYKANDFMSKLYKIYDPTQSLPQKLAALAGLVPDTAFGKNLLAQDMLKTAIAGLTATSQTALDSLVQELAALSSEIGRDNEAAASRASEEATSETAGLAGQRQLARARANARNRGSKSSPARAQAPQQAQEVSPSTQSLAPPTGPQCGMPGVYTSCAAECSKPNFGNAPVEPSLVRSIPQCLEVCRYEGHCSN